MNILVTGSAGFLGSYLVKLLQQNGHQVIGVDLLYHETRPPFYKCDILDGLNLECGTIDLCIHCASQVGGIVHNSTCQELPEYELALLKQVKGFLKKKSCDRVIYLSSINVFENNGLYHHQSLEDLDQTTEYAKAKYKGEKFVEENFSTYLILRPTNLFGQSQTCLLDADTGHNHVIPELIHKIKTQKTVEVFGDGTQQRNFLHVKDLCELILMLIHFKKTSYYSVRSNLILSIADLAKELLMYYNKKKPIEYVPSYLKYEKAPIQNFNIDVLQSLGWTPKIDSIAEGLKL